MNIASPQEIKEYCLAAKGNGADQLTVPLSDLFPLLAQLEVAQQRIAELETALIKSERSRQALFGEKDLLLTANLNAGKRTSAAEAELARRDAAAGAAVAVVDIQSGRADAWKFALSYTSAGHSLPDDVYYLYTAAQPSALPTEITSHEEVTDVDWMTPRVAAQTYWNKAIAESKALGSKAIKLPPTFYSVLSGGKAAMREASDGHWLNKTAVIEALTERGFTVEDEHD